VRRSWVSIRLRQNLPTTHPPSDHDNRSYRYQILSPARNHSMGPRSYPLGVAPLAQPVPEARFGAQSLLFGRLAAYSPRSEWIIAKRPVRKSMTPTALCSGVMPYLPRNLASISSTFAAARSQTEFRARRDNPTNRIHLNSPPHPGPTRALQSLHATIVRALVAVKEACAMV
jgi:hypothetical protein